MKGYIYISLKGVVGINIQEIIYFIVEELTRYLGYPVVPTESEGPKPKYPYIGYKTTTPYNLSGTKGNYTKRVIESLDNRFEHDIEETLEVQPTFTISVNAYSDDAFESQALIKKAHDWFKHIGYDDLSSINVVTVDVQSFTDRTLLIVDNYESRVGFDVILRTVDKIKRRVETIEKYSIKEVKR